MLHESHEFLDTEPPDLAAEQTSLEVNSLVNHDNDTPVSEPSAPGNGDPDDDDRPTEKSDEDILAEAYEVVDRDHL